MLPTRPPSPFLVLLLGALTAALAGEWVRFQVGPWLALPLVLLGTAMTVRLAARAYLARRRWRLAMHRRARRPGAGPWAAEAAPASADGMAAPHPRRMPPDGPGAPPRDAPGRPAYATHREGLGPQDTDTAEDERRDVSRDDAERPDAVTR
ncbi:MAG: hypothetical protein U5K81_01080 [Trueperaceae bacterium]|nr:hypothetical protein [Trueperaceae bacterium]